MIRSSTLGRPQRPPPTFIAMLDADTLLMKRALELARHGAGLVSPNPMVGAILVNEGQVVGEGFHRYDRVKHAETLAIEAAGPLARGATLYCNLEPCCHHGRTPPCTAALIDAKIARAVVAVKDPNPKVNGLGIELLGEAGIQVEAGVLEDRAIQLNETYFKFATRNAPFLHGVLEYSPDADARSSDWLPSDAFLKMAAEYDSLLMGGTLEINKLVVTPAANRERHRPLVVVHGDAHSEFVRDLRNQITSKLIVVPFETEAGDVSGKVVSLTDAIAHARAMSHLDSLAETLARMNVTSVLALDGMLDFSDPSNFRQLDKATLVVPGAMNDSYLSTQWSLAGFEFDFKDVSVTATAGYVELTGYPSLRGVA